MSDKGFRPPVGLICGGGGIPRLVADGAIAAGREPILLCLAGECDPAVFGDRDTYSLRWGEVGKMFRILADAACSEIAFVGAVNRRPSISDIKLDAGFAMLAPKLVAALRQGDDALLKFVAGAFSDRGLKLVSPLALAPALGLGRGAVAGSRPNRAQRKDIAIAATAARALGALDIGQAAVAVDGRVVAVEGAEGTDGLLSRISDLRQNGRIAPSGGVLAKCMKPQQDPRLDVPTIGVRTAELASAAGLSGVAMEAGRCLVAGLNETVEAFRSRDLFLFGADPPDQTTDER